MFDSHCHLQNPELDEERPALIARAQAAGVSGLLLAGVSPEGWEDEDRLARAHPGLFAVAYGVHPQLVAEVEDGEAGAMVQALGRSLGGGPLVRPVAVGEIGLDGQGARAESLDRQERHFREQLALARAHDLPVVLHILEAQGRALAILRRDGLPRRGGVVHSCSASAEMVRQYLALGLHVSFAGPVTLPGARKLHAAARAVPRERLLVETDAPFQTPLAHRPARNEPSFLLTVVEALAGLRGEDMAEVAERTEDNARRLFELPRA
ncbi:MAG TPA: TatD family hydrolase [Polyangia bacterium]|nr:TatD family hydrolase [Polyangia bacterium]